MLPFSYMEKFDAFKNKRTSEDLTAAMAESKLETAAADKEAIEKVLIQRIGFRGQTERQMTAESNALNLDAVYGKFREDIISEAEYIAAAYNEYTEKLKVVAAAQGIEAAPCPIETFIKDVERLEDAIDGGDLLPEYSFYASRENGRERSIQSQIESEIAAVLVPAGTRIGFGPGAAPIETKKTFYRSRPGMARDAAVAEAQAKGAEYLMRSEIHFKEEDGGLEYIKKPEYNYTVVSPEFAELMRGSDDIVRAPFLFRQSDNYGDSIYNRNEAGYMHISPKVELIKLTELEKERAPVTVTITIKGQEFPISESTAKKAISEIGGKIHGNTWGGNFLEVVQNASVTLPDGRKVGLMELNEETLETARMMLPEGEEKKAA